MKRGRGGRTAIWSHYLHLNLRHQQFPDWSLCFRGASVGWLVDVCLGLTGQLGKVASGRWLSGLAQDVKTSLKLYVEPRAARMRSASEKGCVGGGRMVAGKGRPTTYPARERATVSPSRAASLHTDAAGR